MSKWKSNFPFILIVLFLIISFAFLYYISQNQNSLIPYKQPPLVNFRKNNLTSYNLNLTQSTSFAMNFTAISVANKTFSMPLSCYLYIYQNETGWNFSDVDQSVFSYILEPDLIVLEPFGEDSFYLSIEFSRDAQPGRYQFSVKAGNSEETHSVGTSFNINIIE